MQQSPTSHPKRRLRNFLLDPRFQLKFTAYLVSVALGVGALLGLFLWRTTGILFRETALAVEARSQAAQASKEVGIATLNNQLLQHMDDPVFERQLKEESEAIDRRFESEMQEVVEARANLLQRQKWLLGALLGALILFVALVAGAGIVATHHIVGPLFRMRRVVNEVTEGKLLPPSYGLRAGDEFREFFESFSRMVQVLRDREDRALQEVANALEVATREQAGEGVIRALKTLEGHLRSRQG